MASEFCFKMFMFPFKDHGIVESGEAAFEVATFITGVPVESLREGRLRGTRGNPQVSSHFVYLTIWIPVPIWSWLFPAIWGCIPTNDIFGETSKLWCDESLLWHGSIPRGSWNKWVGPCHCIFPWFQLSAKFLFISWCSIETPWDTFQLTLLHFTRSISRKGVPGFPLFTGFFHAHLSFPFGTFQEMWGEPPSSLLSGPAALMALRCHGWRSVGVGVGGPRKSHGFLLKFTQIQYMWICGDSCELGEDLVVTAASSQIQGGHLQRQLARWMFFS